MRVLITGGTGNIGRRLIDVLLNHGHQVLILSRKSLKPAWLPTQVGLLRWDGQTARGWGEQVNQIDAIINLAGAGIADERWSDARKRLILESRVQAGQAVVEAICAAQAKPAVLVQASGINYYGTSQTKTFTEADGPGDDYLADVCVRWEASTSPVEALGVRRAIIRSGVVLDPAGGALPKLVMPFNFFAGGWLGSGQQWMSWIHWQDAVAAIRFLIENEAASGPFNLVTPEPVHNKAMAKTIGQVMGRPALAPAPGFALKLVFGEMATVVLEGQRVLPERLRQLGFEFTWPQLEPALQDLLK
ncbi:MAG TPA: TIGR01777 family oxidoreductase [Anaerolineae bacterium]|nr:TIGR01777 family oxidoreductase [Anaerolineae bacterium]